MGRRNEFHRCDETVALPWQGLYEPRVLRRIPQDFPEPHDRVVQTVVEIDESVAGPKASAQFFARYYFPWLFEKHGQNLKRLFRKLQAQTMLTQFTRLHIGFKSAEPHYPRRGERGVHARFDKVSGSIACAGSGRQNVVTIQLKPFVLLRYARD